VNKVRRESCGVFAFIHRLVIQIVSDIKLLQNSSDNTRRRNVFVWLDARQPQGRPPLNGLTSVSNYFSAFCKPVFDLICVAKKVSNTLNCYFREIVSSAIQLPISIEKFSFLQLTLDLSASSDESNTIHRSHHSLLNNFSLHLPLQAFCYFNIFWIRLSLYFLNYKLKYCSVYIAWSFTLSKVYLAPTLLITPECGVVLHTVA